MLDDFRQVEPARRRAHAGGRIEHFSYLPRGAPARVFVRRSVRGGLLGTLLGGLHLGMERPVHELRAALSARRAGVGVPEPLAVHVTRAAGPFRRFTLVSRELPDAANLLSVVPGLRPGQKRSLIESVADETRRLHEAGVYHADLTLKNILLSGSAVYFIDFDKAVLHERRRDELDIMNLSRLNRSVEKLLGASGCVTRADKLRFLRRYLGGRGRVKELARVCASGLWFHRLWWSLSGQA